MIKSVNMLRLYAGMLDYCWKPAVGALEAIERCAGKVVQKSRQAIPKVKVKFYSIFAREIDTQLGLRSRQIDKMARETKRLERQRAQLELILTTTQSHLNRFNEQIPKENADI